MTVSECPSCCCEDPACPNGPNGWCGCDNRFCTNPWHESNSDRRMKVLDLFAGLCGWSTPWAERGHDVRSLDLDERFDVTYHRDILTWDPEELGDWRPDVILASPPCEGFSVMTIGRNWGSGRGRVPVYDPEYHRPKTERAALALDIVRRTRQVIAELAPAFWIIENPVGKLRGLPVLADLERRTVWYCHYGEVYAKPTDLWGGFPPTLELLPACHNQHADAPDDCCCRDHVAAPRGSRTGVQGEMAFYNSKNSKRRNLVALRAKIPEALALAVCKAAERDHAAGRRHDTVLALF